MQSEFQSAYTNGFTNLNYGNPYNLPTVLRMPLSGGRDDVGVLGFQGGLGVYWSSSPNTINGVAMYFSSTNTMVPASANARASALSIRCIKN